MNEPDVISAIITAGLVPMPSLDELRRWGVLYDEELVDNFKITSSIQPLPSQEEVGRRIENAIASKGFSIFKVTDLDLIDTFMSTAKVCTLRLEDGSDKAVSIVLTGNTLLREIILPWHDDVEDLEDVLTNGISHIIRDGFTYYFSAVSSVYFGSNHAFLLCTPSTVEPYKKVADNE